MRHFLWPILLISISGSDVERSIVNYLNRYYPVENAQYVCDVSNIKIPEDSQIDSIAVDSFCKDNPKGQTVVRLSFYKDGLSALKTSVSVKIGILKPVLVTSQAIKAGESITSEKLMLETRDIAPSDESPILDTCRISGMVASRFMPAGRMLTASSLMQPPVIRSGDKVTIRYSQGPVELSVDGVARESGLIGESIRVMNANSRKIIRAVVLNSSTVAIGEEEF